jgi:hypothetical protein
MCEFNSYNWNSLLFMADILIQKGELKEYQIEKIIDIINIKKLIKYNKLSDDFINKILKPKLEKEYDSSDDDSMTMYDVERYQKVLN